MVLESAKRERISDIPFQITHQVKEMASVCHAVMETQDMGIVYGEPGVGKTVTAEYLNTKWQQRGNPKTIHIVADVGSTPAGVANKILRVLADLRPANTADAARIIENLTQKQELELIIVDEAERLNKGCLEMVRAIFDKTKVPIVLIGMSDLLRQLRSHKKFYSRIGIAYHYEPLSFEQLAEYLGELHSLLKGIDTVFENNLLDFIYTSTKGEFRRINRLVKQAERVRKLNGHPVLSLSVFEAASRLLLNVE